MQGKINILLTAIGCPGGTSIIQSLLEDASLRIVGTDMRKDIPGKYLVDGFYVVPPGRSNNYITYMLNIVKKEKIRVILPLATFELNNLALNKKAFEKEGCSICLSEKNAIDTANNKYLLYKKFKQKKFVPKFHTFKNFEELQEKMQKFGFPEKKVVIRPFISHGSIGLRIIDGKIDLYKQFVNQKPTSLIISLKILKEIIQNRKIDNFILTEFVSGREYGVDLLLDPKTHKVITGIVRDNGDVTLSSVNNGKIIKNQELFRIAKYIAEKLRLSYAVNIDFRAGGNGEYKMLEVNPRLPATSFLATSAGINLPLLSIYLCLGKIFNITQIKGNFKIYSYRGFIVINNNKIINRC